MIQYGSKLLESFPICAASRTNRSGLVYLSITDLFELWKLRNFNIWKSRHFQTAIFPVLMHQIRHASAQIKALEIENPTPQTAFKNIEKWQKYDLPKKGRKIDSDAADVTEWRGIRHSNFLWIQGQAAVIFEGMIYIFDVFFARNTMVLPVLS